MTVALACSFGCSSEATPEDGEDDDEPAAAPASPPGSASAPPMASPTPTISGGGTSPLDAAVPPAPSPDSGAKDDGGPVSTKPTSDAASPVGTDAAASPDAAADAGPPHLTLAWDDNSSNEDGFTIERKTTSGGTFAFLADVGANVTTYTDYAVTNGTQYCYRVRAFNASTVSTFTGEVCAVAHP